MKRTDPIHPSDPSGSSRRDLLASGAALAGAAALGSCASSGESGKQAWSSPDKPIPKAAPPVRLAPDETIRLGLIGTGGMGNGHLDAFMNDHEKGVEKVQVVALADVCRPRLDAALEKCSEKQKIAVDGYRQYADLLSRDDVHAVLIASPEHWHAKMAEDAIAAGKDVYVEKPMTLSCADALRLREVVAANDRILQVGTQYMMYPRYREARKLIAAGAIGHPTLSQTSYCRNVPGGEWLYEIDERVQPGEMLDWEGWCGPGGPAPFDTAVYHRWRRYRRWSTGIIGDLLVHMMTPMMWALDVGWPVRVTASGGHYVDKAMENHDQVFLTVEFEKGHTMIVAGSTSNATGVEPMIRGHRANLYLGGNNCVLRPEQPFVDEVEEQNVQCLDVGDPQDALRRDWLACVRSRQANQSPVEYGARMMVIVDLATRSMWGGEAWRFDPSALTVQSV